MDNTLVDNIDHDGEPSFSLLYEDENARVLVQIKTCDLTEVVSNVCNFLVACDYPKEAIRSEMLMFLPE